MQKKVVWLPYDFDTAIGINNEGSLVFGYELEDIDHTESGADVFNGQQSVIWKNLRDAFGSELATMYRKLRSEGKLSYQAVEQAFENHQNKWPEAIFNEDAWYKYILPLIDDGTGAYLEMLQGSKAEQRKWWLYNRFRYIDSKYNAGDALSDVIQVRGYAKADITVRPYADIYPSVKYGSYLVQKRGKRGQESTLECPLENLNDTEIYIYSASQLASVGDLSGLLVGFADFSMAIRLQELKIGDATGGYTNGNLTSLTLGNNVLLKKIDVRNCTALTQTVDLSGCVNIEEVYFDGSAVTGVTLPNGGVLRKLHLPNTITNLTIQNQTVIEELIAPVENLTTLRLENVPELDTKVIINTVPEGTRVRLIGFAWEASDGAEISAIFDRLDKMRGLDEHGDNVDKAQVSGTIHTDSLTGAEIEEFNSRYPHVTVKADHTSCALKYYTYNGGELLYTETVLDGGDGGSYTGKPSRTETAQYTYTFVGWSKSKDVTSADSDALKAVTRDRDVYAAYSRTTRTYTATFVRASKDGGGTLYTQTGVPYGTTPTYGGSTPTTDQGSAEDYPFEGWTPALAGITGNTTYTATFKDNTSKTRAFIKRSVTSAENDIVTTIGNSAFKSCSNLTSVDFPNVTSIGESAFSDCSNLTSVDFPNVTSIGSYAFSNCSNLTSVDLPNVTTIGNSAFDSCYSLASVDFPNVTSIVGSVFSNCIGLTSVDLPNVTTIGNSAFSSCYSLASVDLPNVTSIESYAFKSCSSLNTIILRANRVASLGGSYGFPSMATVYVPDDLVESYKTANNWSSIASQIKGISELPEE